MADTARERSASTMDCDPAPGDAGAESKPRRSSAVEVVADGARSTASSEVRARGEGGKTGLWARGTGELAAPRGAMRAARGAGTPPGRVPAPLADL